MAYCEDFPACGHHADDPCERQWYDEPGAFDPSVNPHAFCDHEYGICEADYGDDFGDCSPEDCDHCDQSYAVVRRGDDLFRIDRECDRCFTDLPDEKITDPDEIALYPDK